MLQSFLRILILIVTCCFLFSLLRNSSLSSSQMSEEQIELIIKFNGNEEEELHDCNVNSFFKGQINFAFHSSINDLWNATRHLSKNYAEPNLDTPYSPPELKA